MNHYRIQIHRVKRLTNLMVALISIVFAAPLAGLLALLVRFGSPGPILNRQEQLGSDSALFEMLQFHTGVTDAEKTQAVWAAEDDLRVTRIGRFLRKTRLDEFPQFISARRDDLVGPRPEPEVFIQQLAEKMSFTLNVSSLPPA